MANLAIEDDGLELVEYGGNLARSSLVSRIFALCCSLSICPVGCRPAALAPILAVPVRLGISRVLFFSVCSSSVKVYPKSFGRHKHL